MTLPNLRLPELEVEVPANPEFELAVLGSVLLDPDVADRCRNLPPEAFWDSTNRKAWTIIQSRIRSGGFIEPGILAQDLRHKQDLRDRIAEAAKSISTPAHGTHYASRLVDLMARRKARGAAIEILQSLSPEDAEASYLVEKLEEARDALQIADPTVKVQGWGRDAVDAVLAGIEADESEDVRSGLSYGFGALDRMNVRLRPGDYHVLAGWTGQGKSALAAQVAYGVALREERPVVYVSLEMTRELLVRRAILNRAAVDDPGLAPVRDEYRQLVRDAAEIVREAPVLVPQGYPRDVASFAPWLRNLVKASGACLVVIDHLGLLKGDGRSLYERTSDISRTLRSWANDGDGVPLLALSQLSRLGKRELKAPGLDNLRDSGALEEDAVVALFVHYPWGLADHKQREKLGQDVPNAQSNAWVIVGKNRAGACGRVGMTFQGARARWLAKHP